MQIIAIKPIIGLEIHRKVTGKPFECDDKLAQVYIEKGLASEHNTPNLQEPEIIIPSLLKRPDEPKQKRRKHK